ncbi:MAG: hypothetical protein V7K56_06915 [Nostoc sp.]
MSANQLLRLLRVMELKQLAKKLEFSRIKTRKQAAHRFRNADAGTYLEFIGGEFIRES